MSLGAGGAAAAAAGVALVVSALLTALTVRTGPVDPLGQRTSHRRPTPTSGGVAIVAATTLGLAANRWLGGASAGMDSVGLALACAGGVGLVGALDDMADLDAKVKLALLALLAVAFTALTGPPLRLPLGHGWAIPLAPVVGMIGGGLWIVTAANAVNFMDGANGLAPGAQAIAFAALAAAGFAHGDAAIGAAALCAAAACAAFLPFNLGGRLFQGDVGALFAAFLFAALCLAAAGHGAPGLYFGPTVLAPFLTDVLLTLLDRARRRQPLLNAHRDHLYQRWLQRTGRSHGDLAWRAGLINAASALLAVAASFTSDAGQLAGLVLAVVLSVAAWRRIGRGLAA